MIEQAAASMAKACQRMSLASLQTIFTTKPARELFMEFYVIGFAVVLTVIINVVKCDSQIWALLVSYRIIDIVSYRVYYLLLKSKQQPWTEATCRRSLLIAFLNVYELVIAFGALYIYSGQVMHGNVTLADPLSATYFSAVTLMTVGYGDYTPMGQGAQLLVCTQLLSGMVMLTFIIPALISLLGIGGNRSRAGL